MSRHRNRQYDLDDYDDYYDDDYDDYDGYSKPVAVAQKPKPKKKNKKATAPAAGAGAAPAAPAATTAGATPPPPPGLACGGSTSTQSSQPPAASAGASAPGMLHEVHSTHLFSGLSDDEGESKKKHSAVAEKGEAELPCLTVIIAGHVDAGKSTLVGNLLFQTGRVSSRVIELHQKEAERSGKSSFHFAWVTDESASEREHGVTISSATKFIQTDHRQIALLDAPGHRDYVPNMISSAALADAALLVVPATSGEFETAISTSSQTREHAVLLKAMGCNTIVVIVNKMDRTEPAWCEGRYNSVCGEVRRLLESLQFAPASIQCIPVSGLTGANVVSAVPAAKGGRSAFSTVNMTEVCPWYRGPTLLEALDFLPIISTTASNATSSSLRAVVSSVSDSQKGCDVSVKILRGKLKVGQTVGFLGGADGVASVKSMRAGSDSRPLPELGEREQGIVTLVDRMNNSSEKMGLSSGTILFKGPPRLRPATLFKAAIITLPDILPPIINGSEFELFILGREVICCVKKICGHRNGTTCTSTAVKCVPGGRSAVVHIATFEPVMIEEFSKCRALGRFVLRSHGKTYAVGIVEKLYQ